MLDECTLAASPSCSVIAPAGCGKTELIAKAVAAVPAPARFLVLTHTHAGVRAIRQRFKMLRVRPSRARIDTVAGWCLDYALSYPATTNCRNAMPTTDDDWEAVYAGAERLLELPAIRRVISATYSAVYIDEYQDCTRTQHAIAVRLSKIIPCRVLGDPLQRIFQFAGATLSWNTDVERSFPPAGELKEPWRWKIKNPALGKWLLQTREQLIQGQPIDLTTSHITWMEAGGQNQGKVAIQLLGRDGSVIAIRMQKGAAHKFASLSKGYSSMEEVHCNDLLLFAQKMDTLSGPPRALAVLQFASAFATRVKSYLKSEIAKLAAGQAVSSRLVRNEGKQRIVDAIAALCSSNDLSHVATVLGLLARIPEARVFRRDLMWAAKDALTAKAKGSYSDLHEAAWKSRSRSRHFDKRLHPRLVSRTLLIKGLEFEHAFVVNADEFSGQDAAQHFYVAISRGSTSLTVLSSSSSIQFQIPIL